MSLVASGLLGLALLVLGSHASADPLEQLTGPRPGETVLTASTLLESQPSEIVARLRDEKLVMMQELREAGSMSGGLMVGLVIFEQPVERVYRYLSQTARQVEYRPELTSIETVTVSDVGPVDVQRISVLFRRYEYRLKYTLVSRFRNL